MFKDKPPIEAADMVAGDLRDDSFESKTLQALVNAMHTAIAPYRAIANIADENIDGVAITACAVLAGCIHGELHGIGAVADLTDEAVTKVMTVNFRVGQRLGMECAKEAEALRAAEVVDAANISAARGGETMQ